MTTTADKQVLSGSTNGKQIKVAATATLGTTIHQNDTVAGNVDEVFLSASNSSGSDVVLTLEWGGVATPDDLKVFTLLANAQDVLIVPGHVIENNLSITAFAGTTNVIMIDGWINRLA